MAETLPLDECAIFIMAYQATGLEAVKLSLVRTVHLSARTHAIVNKSGAGTMNLMQSDTF